MIVLKRLSDAVRDGDTVLALMRGSAVNQDGPSSGLTVPNGPAQQAVAARGAGAARLRALGDRLHRGARHRHRARRPDRSRRAQCGFRPARRLGAAGARSVKTNLGHLENSAGIAGFIKTVLSMNHGYIPPHLHFTGLTPNARAARRSSHCRRRNALAGGEPAAPRGRVVVRRQRHQRPRCDRAGAGRRTVAAQPEPVISTLVISGKTPARIAPIAEMLADWMSGAGAEVPLADVAHTVNNYRGRYRSFAAVAARNHEQAVAGLRALAAGEPATGVVEPTEKPHGSGTVFLYSGQGSQWAGMGRQLLADEPAFAAAVAELEPDFVAQVGFSLRDMLLAGEPVVGIERIQPVLVGMQLALTALWRSYGVEPDAVIGHSMGEVTAAVVSGALSPADGLKVIATRSKLMSRLSGQGAMALLELGAAEAEKLVGQYPDVTVAVYAAPQQTVIAGPPEQIDAVDRRGRRAGHVGAPRGGGCGLASPDGRPDPGRVGRRAGRPEADDAEDPVDQHGRSGRRRARSSMPITGW